MKEVPRQRRYRCGITIYGSPRRSTDVATTPNAKTPRIVAKKTRTTALLTHRQWTVSNKELDEGAGPNFR